MTSDNAFPGKTRSMQTRRSSILGALISCAFMLPQACLARNQALNPDDISNTSDSALENIIEPGVRPVEAGEGGDIKLERKYRTAAESLYEWHGHVLWENRYVTEGRDNLAGNNLVSLSTEFAIGEFSIVPWFATSPAADYKEFNLNVVYGFRLAEKIVLYGGYNRIQSKLNSVRSDDNEISLDLAYKISKKVHVLASAYHSFEADGSFLELAIKRRHRINDKTRANAQALLGTNAGYISDGHHGPNHVQLRANITYEPSLRMELYAYSGYNIAINRDETRYAGDLLLGDFFWGGLGFTYRF